MGIRHGYAFLFQVLFAAQVLAAPAQDPTLHTWGTEPGRQVTVASEPYGRGTFRIIVSSTAAFIFCIWTAVHPNIIGSTSTGYRVFYKSTLMILAVLIPEGLIMMAFGEFREAMVIRDAWRAKLKIKKGSKDDLGMDGAFFVLMGGFVVDERTTTTDGRPYTAILTTKGFKHYLEAGLLHEGNIHKRDITDKGKANNIAKLLAGGQALWLVVQCIARWVESLPVTLLEVHVLIQIATTSMIYLLWWSKPLDVNEPLRIELKKKDVVEPVRVFENEDELLEQVGLTKTRGHHYQRCFITKSPPANIVSVFSQTYYEILAFIDPNTEAHIVRTEAPAVDDKHFAEVSTADKSTTSGFFWLYLVAEGTLVTVSGVLHAAAWNMYFPTPLEALLWRLSSLAMCVFPLFVVGIVACTKYHEDLIDVVWRMRLDNKGHSQYIPESLEEVHKICLKRVTKTAAFPIQVLQYAKHLGLVVVTLSFLFGYGAAIGYITVESFLSLRDLPVESFYTPKWTTYWPHI